MDLSVVIPFVREWPQVTFTIRAIHEELKDIEHEIIAVDNLMHNMDEDRGSNMVKGMANCWTAAGDPWLKYFRKDDKLSHWQCKNFAVEKASADIIWFVDSHCIPGRDSGSSMFRFYEEHWQELDGSIHLPLTYHILEPRQLIYKAVVNSSIGDYAYSFNTYRPNTWEQVQEVPAMSTCGMMIHKNYLKQLGGWPKELGIYSGGEHFLNYCQAILGMKKYIWKAEPLCHHGDKRGYSWNYYDQRRNRGIASYLIGGEKLLRQWIKCCAKLSPNESARVINNIMLTCREHRDHILSQQLMTIEEWLDKWKGHELLKGTW
jgi:hypothetical protein